MAKASPPPAVKLICGMISADEALFLRARDELSRRFGTIDIVSDVMDFDFTHYYDAEMGSPLKRQFVAFGPLANPDTLAAAKVATNEMEDGLGADRAALAEAVRNVQRPINLDVGYVESGKLVLASMKNFSHRVYLRDGVYAEVTLMYQRTAWRTLPWTFSDYGSGRYWPFLNAVRARLRLQMDEETST